MKPTVYLLHLSEPLGGRAQHYLGWAPDLIARQLRHAQGNGALLLKYAKAAGITWEMVRTWRGDYTLERRLKGKASGSSHAKRLCPVCHPEMKRIRRWSEPWHADLATFPVFEPSAACYGKGWLSPGGHPRYQPVEKHVDGNLAVQLNAAAVLAQRTAGVKVPGQGPEPVVDVQLDRPASATFLRDATEHDNVLPLTVAPADAGGQPEQPLGLVTAELPLDLGQLPSLEAEVG